MPRAKLTAKKASVPTLVAALGSGDAAVKVQAAKALAGRADESDANRVAIAEAGGIVLLVELVRGGSADAQETAADALWKLAKNDANKVAIARAGGIAPLIELVRSGSAFAAKALFSVATNGANLAALAEAGAIAKLVDLMRNGSTFAKEGAVAPLCVLALDDANAAAIVEAGGIAPLVELARGGSTRAKTCVVAALGSLADNDANAAAIWAAGGVAPLEQLARDGEGNTKTWATSALAKVRAAAAAQAEALVAARRERQAPAASASSAAAATARERRKAERMQARVNQHMPEPPKDYACPITHEAMIDPVVDALGNTYERSAIERWLRDNNTAPLTGEVLPDKLLAPNNALKSLILVWDEEAHEKCMAMAPTKPIQDMSSGELKAEVRRRGLDMSGCAEKGDLVELLGGAEAKDVEVAEAPAEDENPRRKKAKLA